MAGRRCATPDCLREAPSGWAHCRACTDALLARAIGAARARPKGER